MLPSSRAIANAAQDARWGKAAMLLGCAILAGCGGGSSADQSTADPVSNTGLGTPIVAAPRAWVWTPFGDAHCADGSTTGLGVNLNPSSNRVLIYFAGGGACWSESTCYQLNTAVHFSTGYGASEFAAEAADTSYLSLPGGLFDRSAAGNPFKDYNYVYVPYCTGDLHAGNNIAQYGTHTAAHVGFANMTAYLRRLQPTFPTADRVVLAGSSAGGFGATFNLWQTHQAFNTARVDLLNDSGPILPAATLSAGNGLFDAGRVQWNMAATLPAGCTQCATQLDAIYTYYASALPGSRLALLSYDKDAVVSVYFGITEPEFNAGLAALIAGRIAPAANFKSFTASGQTHTMWFTPSLSVGGTSIGEFITQMVNDDPAWASVHP